MSPDTCRTQALQATLSADHTTTDTTLYVLLRAVDRFHSTFGHFPGSFDTGMEDDTMQLKNMAMQVRGLNEAFMLVSTTATQYKCDSMLP